jgi:subtilase family serine protease
MSLSRVARRGLATASTVGVLVTLGAAAAPSASASVASSSWGSTATLATSIQGATLTGSAPASAPVRLAVTLQPQNAAAEQAALRAMYQPGSATFHQFLTPAQWEAAYAPTSAQVSAVTSYLSSNGFTGVSVQGDRMLISATGTVKDAETAFNTTIGNYVMANGSTFRANIGGAQVPSSLTGIVQAVVGLSNWRLPTPQPALMTQTAASKSTARRMAAARRMAVTRHAATNGTSAGSPVIPNEIPPEDFQNTYDAAGTPTGARTAVALFTEGNVSGAITDLRTAEAAFSLPQVGVSIIKVGPQSTDTAGADEWDLDTQSSSAMATTLKHIYLYNVGALNDTNIDTAVAAFVSQDKAVAMSASVGGCDIGPYLDGSMISTDNVLTEGAMQGQTFFASSGDNGDGCAFVAATGVPSSFPGTNWPASGMYATAVGGTSLVSDASGNRVQEIGWVGSGGGDSETEVPGFWTQASDPFYTQGAVMGGRAVPDIALDADPNVATAAEIYVNGTPTGIGGTSLSSPLALGSWARLQSGHGNKLGMAAIDFYALYDAVNPSLGDTSPVPGFTDIVGGNNGGYTATPGYDEVTGIGALDIAALNSVIAGS